MFIELEGKYYRIDGVKKNGDVWLEEVNLAIDYSEKYLNISKSEFSNLIKKELKQMAKQEKKRKKTL